MTEKSERSPTAPPTADGGSASGSETDAPRRKWYTDPLLLAILVVAFVADQITKTLIVRNLRLGESWPADGFFRLTYARNTGTAFGLFQDQAMILTIISFVAVAAIIYFYRNTLSSPLLRAALGLQLGGAFGNLLDRLRLGYVIDFIDVGPWPIFNLADSSIVVGIAVLAWHFAFRHDSTPASPAASPSAPPPPLGTPGGPPGSSPSASSSGPSDNPTS